MCGDTAMPPAFATCESVWAAEIRPAWSGAPITPYRANEAVGSGMAVIASSTARTPTTVCSSQCRRNRGGSAGAPAGLGASRRARTSVSGTSTIAWLSTTHAGAAAG